MKEPEIIQEEKKNQNFTIAVICPSCGSGISFIEGNTKVTCRHCGLSHIVVGRGGLKKFYIPKRIEREKAIGAVKKLVKKKETDEGVRMSVRLIDAKLVYVPFYKVKVKGGGWYIGEKPQKTLSGGVQAENGEIIVPKIPREKVTGSYSKEISYFTPALNITELGMFAVSTQSSALELHIFNHDLISPKWMVFDAVKDPKAASREARAALSSSARPTEFPLLYFEAKKISEDISQIFYPLWIVRFLYGGEAVRVVVDGIRGNIIKARLPSRKRTNIIPGILILSVLAFFLTLFPMITMLVFLLLISAPLILGKKRQFLSSLNRFFIRPWEEEEIVIG